MVECANFLAEGSRSQRARCELFLYSALCLPAARLFECVKAGLFLYGTRPDRLRGQILSFDFLFLLFLDCSLFFLESWLFLCFALFLLLGLFGLWLWQVILELLDVYDRRVLLVNDNRILDTFSELQRGHALTVVGHGFVKSASNIVFRNRR